MFELFKKKPPASSVQAKYHTKPITLDAWFCRVIGDFTLEFTIDGKTRYLTIDNKSPSEMAKLKTIENHLCTKINVFRHKSNTMRAKISPAGEVLNVPGGIMRTREAFEEIANGRGFLLLRAGIPIFNPQDWAGLPVLIKKRALKAQDIPSTPLINVRINKDLSCVLEPVHASNAWIDDKRVFVCDYEPSSQTTSPPRFLVKFKAKGIKEGQYRAANLSGKHEHQYTEEELWIYREVWRGGKPFIYDTETKMVHRTNGLIPQAARE